MKHFSTLRQLKSFLLLWSSQAVSTLGTAMTEYALIVWAYGREGTASSITLLTLCSFAPTILFRFAAGAIADRWDKKRIMLIADLFAACGTFSIFLLDAFSALQTWHIYLINILLSMMNAFQEPAAFVATSLLVPKEHYTKASGLQGVSGAVISILSPALGSVLLAFGCLRLVLLCDLGSFFVAFCVLLFLIRIPKIEKQHQEQKEPFRKTCTEGIRYLRGQPVLLHLILFMTCVNFLAKLGDDGMLAPFILGRTGDDQRILGAVESAIACGILVGSLLVTGMKPVRNRLKLIFWTTAVVFSGNLFLSLSLQPWVWCVASFGSYAMAALMNANMTVLMRERVPIEMQGRVFSAESTLKNGSIPLGLLLGGLLADHVAEPFMAKDSPLQRFLVPLFGDGKGSGIALIFFVVGILGIILSLTRLRKQKDDNDNCTLQKQKE